MFRIKMYTNVRVGQFMFVDLMGMQRAKGGERETKKERKIQSPKRN